MIDRGLGTIVTTEERPRERFEAAGRGDASWLTLLSGDITPTSRMSAGVMELAPGSTGLKPHRHQQPEIYFIVAGSGTVTIDGVDADVSPDAAIFIPADAEDRIRNTGPSVLRVFYVFPADRFSDVVYRFAEADESAP